MLTKNIFKKFLVDEICRKSNTSPCNALKYVNEYSKTREFNLIFQKWVDNAKVKYCVSMPKSIKSIFKEINKNQRKT